MATKILLADDSPTIAKILTMALQSEPYEIRSVLNAFEAVKQLRADPPYFFLVDLELPEKNGYEFAKFVHQDPKLKNVKVVVLASAFEPVDQEKLKDSGVDGVISKPFDPADLRAKLRQILEAPPDFPKDAEVSGALSGTAVNLKAPPKDSAPSLEEPGNIDDLILSSPEADQGEEANSILANLMGDGSSTNPSLPSLEAEINTPNEHPPISAPQSMDEIGSQDISVSFDVPSETPTGSFNESVLDLSSSFSLPQNDLPMAPVAHEEAAPPIAPAAPLSPNAQALAAFFEAEIGAKEVPNAPTESQPDDSFDASQSSIEWSPGADADLNAWSSPPPRPSQTSHAQPTLVEESTQPSISFEPETPPPFPGNSSPPTREKSASPNYAGASAGENFLFDTGRSNFRFAEDYVHRITKSFTGAMDESVPTSHHQAHTSLEPTFPRHSDDRPPPVPKKQDLGGGAWNEAELKKIEQLVKDEVQMVVREVAEKVAWEVIPDLAENLIKKELEKVLKQMEE